MNSYRNEGEIEESQIMGLITHIPKGIKLGNEYKYWHPMTLLISVYEFYSAILAERIKKNLPKLIYI